MKLKIMARSLIAAGILTAGVGLYGAGAYGPSLVSHAQAAATASVPVAPATLTSALPDFTGIVAQNGPAVVNITVTSKAGGFQGMSGNGPQMDPNDPFFQFFRQFAQPMPQQQQPVHGLGSGFIVSADGIILTNAHVVDGAKDVTVKLTDRREFKAKVLGVDKASDIAVLKISAGNLPTVRMDTTDDVKVGQWVVAIGAPFGFENSATAGIVSAKSRALPNASYPFIQTDVPVNPGNSGGPLFNAKGEVVGINSQIYTRSGGFQGISFAIPIDAALHVKDQLVAHGTVTRGQLGVSIQEVNQDLADAFGMKQPGGALVSSVKPGSAAARAGIEPGDVITAYNGRKIEDSSDLPTLVANTNPGETAKVDVIRKGDTKHLNVTVGRMENEKVASADTGSEAQGRLGVAVRPLSPGERQADAGGVVVEQASGPAADAGIQPGDVILSMNGSPIKTPEDLKQLVGKSGKHAAVLVQRDDQRIFIPVDLG